MPGPSSATVIVTPVCVARARRRVTCLPPAAAASAALRTRFHTTWRSFAGSARIGERLVDVARELDVGERLVGARDLEGLADEDAEIEVDGLARPRVRVVEQVADQHVEPLDLAVDDRHQRAVVLGGLRARHSSSIEPEIDGERIADLVGDAGGELADGGEPLGAPHVLLEPAQLGEVVEVDDAADHLIADVAQRRHRDAERESRRS